MGVFLSILLDLIFDEGKVVNFTSVMFTRQDGGENELNPNLWPGESC